MRKTSLIAALLLLSACGGDGDSPVPFASKSNVVVSSQAAGVTPFIALVELSGSSLASARSISYSIQSKPGSVSKPANIGYSIEALNRRQQTGAAGSLQLPVFGLYAGYSNTVSINIQFIDGSIASVPLTIVTAAYADPSGIYDRPLIIKQRVAGTSLGFDFFVLKSELELPVIIDTDGELRWVGGAKTSSTSSIFVNNGFVIGDATDSTVYRAELDGSIVATVLSAAPSAKFEHNIDFGKAGLLGELTFDSNVATTISEFTPFGGFGKTWDFAQLISAYMTSQGDDATLFVRPGIDWFHSNSSIYDPRDNSIIVSSRENFLMKVDYDSGAVIWILGDPTKYWYTFPSLRAKALTLQNGGIYPIGQHAVSITSDGLIMVMNDGTGSVEQPAGAPAGESRTYSAVSAYSIDLANRSATEAWHFDYGQTILSAYCGSAYEAGDQSVLVDFAAVDNFTNARLVGLDAQQNVVFDFQYATTNCNTGWNAVPVPLEKLRFE
jgi:arylsulfate sulfotransferase